MPAAASSSSGPPKENHAFKILYELENPETIDSRKPVIPDRGRLCDVEKQKVATWIIPDKPRKLAQSSSAPGLGDYSDSPPRAQMSKAKATQLSKVTQLEVHKRGMGVSLRPDISKSMGLAKDNVLGPGQYDTHNVGGMSWERSTEMSNPAQKQVSNHKTPPRVSFGKTPVGGNPQKLLSERPGPGHYAPPDYWDPNWQRFPSLGKSFTRKPPQPVESRFGGLARGMVGGSKSQMNFLGN